MPMSAAMIRANNIALARENEETILLALKTVLAFDLVLQFDHQDETYICDAQWQDFQHVRFPRQSYWPVPIPVFARLSEKTRALFLKHRSREFPEDLRSDVVNSGRVDHRLTANGKRRMARKEGECEGEEGEKPEFQRLIDAYHEEFVTRHHVKPEIGKREAAQAQQLVKKHGLAAMTARLHLYFTGDPWWGERCHPFLLFSSTSVQTQLSVMVNGTPRAVVKSGNLEAGQSFMRRRLGGSEEQERPGALHN